MMSPGRTQACNGTLPSPQRPPQCHIPILLFAAYYTLQFLPTDLGLTDSTMLSRVVSAVASGPAGLANRTAAAAALCRCVLTIPTSCWSSN